MSFKVDSRINQDRYDGAVGLGLYLTGKMLKNAKLIEKKMDAEISRLVKTIQVLKDEFYGSNDKTVLWIVIDDCSPYKVDLRKVFEDDYCIIELMENVGIGHKENILETGAKGWAPFLFRFDQDVRIKGPIKPLFDAFDHVNKLFCAGINSGFIGA